VSGAPQTRPRAGGAASPRAAGRGQARRLPRARVPGAAAPRLRPPQVPPTPPPPAPSSSLPPAPRSASTCNYDPGVAVFPSCSAEQLAINAKVMAQLHGGAPLKLQPCDLWPYLRGRTLWIIG
jgi:hypothetical protein